MISLNKVCKSYGRGRKASPVLVDVSLELDNECCGFGILGAAKSGKTTLLQIACGLIAPDRGKISRQLSLSWPLNWRGFGRDMTGDDQVELLARMYRRDREGLLRYVAEVSGLDAKLYEPMRGYSAREKDRLMQAAAFGIDFDLYLIDEDIPGVEKPFAPRYEALAQEILLSSRFVICSSSPSKIRNHCKTAALLADGSLSEIASPSEIEDVFKRSVRGANQHI